MGEPPKADVSFRLVVWSALDPLQTIDRNLSNSTILAKIRNLNWKNALAELSIITLGVLMALAIDEWNDSRLDLGEEMRILDRIMLDLDADLISTARARKPTFVQVRAKVGSRPVVAVRP